MKTNELTGPALDWAVAKIEGFETRNNYRVWVTQEDEQIVFDCCADDQDHACEQAQDAYPGDPVAAAEPLEPYQPSTDWAHGGPIIEREGIRVHRSITGWWASSEGNPHHPVNGSTLLVAAMRCYVASVLGDEVDIPEEIAA